MHLAGPLAFRVCGQLPQVSVAGAPCRPSATPCAQSGEPGLVENAPHRCPARPRAGNRSQSPSRPRPQSFHACGQPSPGSVAGAPCRPPATPYAQTTEPARRRERTSAGEYGPRGCRPRTSVHPRAPGALIQQTVTYDGDIPRGRVRVLPARGIRRRRGQQSRPRTRHLSPAAQECPHTRRMSPATAPECGASMASRATGAPAAPAPTSNHDLRAPHTCQKRPGRGRRSQLQGRGGSQPWGKSARPRRPDPGGVDPAGRPVSTALTSTSPPSKTSPRIVGILRFLHSARRRCWVDVSTMDTGDPPDLFPRPTLASETTDHL